MADQSHWEDFEKLRDIRNKINNMDIKNEGLSLFYTIQGFFLDIPYYIKSAYQRATRGFADSEIWGLHATITEFVYPRIKFFTQWQAEHGYATPTEFAADPAQWLEVLNKITRAFELMSSEEPLGTYFTPPSEEDYGTKNEFASALKQWRENNKLYDKEIQEGLKLFGRYYRNLWD